MDRADFDFEATPGGSDADSRPRNRDSLFLIARLRIADEATAAEVRVRNLSEGGLMAELDRVLAIGTVATLDLRGIGLVAGKVAWCAERRIGIAFDRPIDPRLARKPVGAGAKTPEYAKSFFGVPGRR